MGIEATDRPGSLGRFPPCSVGKKLKGHQSGQISKVSITGVWEASCLWPPWHFFKGFFLRAPFSFFHVTYCSHFFLLRFRLSVPQTGAWIFVKGSSQAVIRMIGCEMTSVLFSFLWDSSLVFCLVSSLGDVTEICKIAQLWYTGRLPIPSSCSEHQS